MSIILHIYDIDCSYQSKVSEHSSMESLGCHYTSKVEVWFRYIHIQLKVKDRCSVFKSIVSSSQNYGGCVGGKTQEISAGADGGPRSRVCACLTPHRHQWKFVGAHVWGGR